MGCNLELAAAQPDLWVTARGERFCDETIAFWDTPVGNANARYKKDGYTFSMFDDSIIERLHGARHRQGRRRGLPCRATSSLNLRKEIQAALDNGSKEVFAADSLEAAGREDGDRPGGPQGDRGRVQRLLRPRATTSSSPKTGATCVRLSGPKFYAVRARTVFLGTMGGIKVNEKLEVLDKKDEVIPGLYAGGFRRRRHVRRQLPHQEFFGPGFGVRAQLRPHRRQERAQVPWAVNVPGEATVCGRERMGHSHGLGSRCGRGRDQPAGALQGGADRAGLRHLERHRDRRSAARLVGDPRGERFCDETVAFWDTHVGKANVKYARDGDTWNLVDDSTLEQMIERGIDNNVGGDFMSGYKPVNVFREIQAALDRGSTEVVAADSVEELAGKMGADPALLRATVDEYNDCCAKGRDRLFAKDPKFLRPCRGHVWRQLPHPCLVRPLLRSCSQFRPDRREKCTQVREGIG